MRNVLLLITGDYTIGGGIAAVNRLMVKALADWNRGACRMTILALHEPVGAKPDPFYLKPNQGVRKTFGGNTLAFAMEAWRCALSKRYDLILADMVGIASALTPLTVIGLHFYVVWCHGLEVSEKDLSLRRRWALIHAQKLLANSPTTYQNVLKRFPSVNISLCELALDPKIVIQPIRSKVIDSVQLTSVSGVEKVVRRRVILCVGRMWSDQCHKGQDALIKAMPKIRTNCPDAQLILAGGGDWRDELAALAATLNVADFVFIPGFVPEEMLSRLYSCCRAFVMPSKGEGFGLVYLEAMNWSKPCVGGRLDAARDVIVDHETGFLLDEPHNPDQIANAVIQLLSNPELSEKMGRAGKKRLEQKYLFSHFCERFYRVLGWT